MRSRVPSRESRVLDRTSAIGAHRTGYLPTSGAQAPIDGSGSPRRLPMNINSDVLRQTGLDGHGRAPVPQPPDCRQLATRDSRLETADGRRPTASRGASL